MNVHIDHVSSKAPACDGTACVAMFVIIPCSPPSIHASNSSQNMPKTTE